MQLLRLLCFGFCLAATSSHFITGAIAQIYTPPENAIIRNHNDACKGWAYDQVGYANEFMAFLDCKSEEGDAWFPIKIGCFGNTISLRFEENPNVEEVGAPGSKATVIWTIEAQDEVDIFTYLRYEAAVPDWATYLAKISDHPLPSFLKEGDHVSVTFLFASAIDQFPLAGSKLAIERAMQDCDPD